MKINLIGKTYEELIECLEAMGEKSFRAKQVWHFIYVKGVTDFNKISSISKELRNKLNEMFTLERPQIVKEEHSEDGTIKYLLRLFDNKEVETVYIPTAERGTLCVSSQVGCNMGCTFCHTGTQKMVRNLSAAEIVGQIMLVKDILGEFKQLKKSDLDKRLLSNVVYMGMGEPLQNYKEVVKSIKIINHQEGLAISKRKITVSTCGIIPKIRDLYKDIPVNLSISLHATTNDLRTSIMPINNQYPIESLIDVANEYYHNSNSKRITFVYLMIKGINDTDEHLMELAKIGLKVPSKFNLIPFHPWDGCNYQSSDKATIKRFSDYLHNIGFTSTIRETRGDDILAACGQLKSKTERERKFWQKETIS